MPDIPDNFEPNKASMHKWFGTRKKTMVFGTVELPGFFQTYNYNTDTLLVCIIVILELGGALAIMYEGGFTIYSTVPVLLAIIVDTFLAILLHKNVPKRIELINRAKATENPQQAQRDMLLSHKGKGFELLVKSGIYLIAIFKGIAYLAFSMEVTPLSILMFIIYLIIAQLHISTTGYWVDEFLLNISIKQQYKKHIENMGSNNSNVPKERISVFACDNPITCLNVGQHKLMKGDGENDYKIKTIGVLTDNQLASMVAAQSQVNLQSVVASACIKHQIQNILLG